MALELVSTSPCLRRRVKQNSPAFGLIDPEVSGFLIQHGRALFELGEFQRAKAELELAIEKLAGDIELSQEPAATRFYQSEVLGP